MRDRIRVLEFVTSFHFGGTERQFVNLVRGLPRRTFRLELACFRAEGIMLRELQKEGLPLRVISIPRLHSATALRRLVALAHYLRRERIDVVHTTGIYPNVFGVAAARLAGTPVIIASVRDQGAMWSAGLRRMQRVACRWAHAVVTNAEAIARQLEAEGIDPGKITIIRNGIDAAAAPVLPRRGALRRELGIADDAPLIGSVCRLDRVKGLEHFVDAAAIVAERHPRARFLVVGGSPYQDGVPYIEELRRRAARLGLGDRMILTGARTDVPEILPDLTISILSSLSEGLSNTILESMAAALPVIATTVGGNPELVKDGATGLLVPPADPAALAAAIDRLLVDPAMAARLGRAGRARVEAQFTRARMVESTRDLYLRLLGRRMEALPMESVAGPGRARTATAEVVGR